MNEETIEKLSDQVVNCCFDEPEHLTKVLWRLSRGSRGVALNITKKTMEHYKFPQDLTEEEFGIVFDHACAKVSGGTEVEWVSE